MSKIIVAAAGSGKTSTLLSEALSNNSKRVLLTTYTNENLACIRERLIALTRVVPREISVVSWFRFLLKDGARPYQNTLGVMRRIEGINFLSNRMSTERKYLKKSNTNYYIDGRHYIYRDQLSDFVCQCNGNSKGLVIQRLERIYDLILIDEMQDLAAYDLDFLELLLNSSIKIIMTGDPRQSTYSTSRSRRNKKFKGVGIMDWINKLSKETGVSLEIKNECFRCNQAICNFADSLYPGMPSTISKNHVKTAHDGVFSITRSEVNNYFSSYKPQLLRYDRNVDTYGYDPLNFGVAKGREFDRVLIFPTKDIRDCYKQNDFTKLKEGTRCKLYVGITRAKQSVAFVTD